MNSMDYDGMAEEVISGSALSREQAMDLASSPDVEILTLLSAAFKIRRRFHGRTVNLHILQNAKSGLCPEDCKFCSQSTRYGGDAERYPIKTVEDLLAGARTALASGAVTYCMVTSTRGPSARELQTICEASRQIKGEMPGLRLCASLGLLADGQAGELKRAGVDRYNHQSRDLTAPLSRDRYDPFDPRQGQYREAIQSGWLGGMLRRDPRYG